MVGMKIGITGDKALKKRLNSARRAMTDFRPWLKQAELIAIESVQTNFIQEGRPDKWPGLKLATLLSRGAEVGGGGRPKPLRDKGILIASIGAPKQHSGGVSIMDKFSLETGTQMKYARPQHFGTRDGHIPPRPFMFLQDIDETRITILLVEFLDKSLKAV